MVRTVKLHTPRGTVEVVENFSEHTQGDELVCLSVHSRTAYIDGKVVTWSEQTREFLTALGTQLAQLPPPVDLPVAGPR